MNVRADSKKFGDIWGEVYKYVSMFIIISKTVAVCLEESLHHSKLGAKRPYL